MTDGEGIERLWSFLRGFSSMTKEMNTGRRTDILTDALLHYSARQLQQFGNTLLWYSLVIFSILTNDLLVFRPDFVIKT